MISAMSEALSKIFFPILVLCAVLLKSLSPLVEPLTLLSKPAARQQIKLLILEMEVLVETLALKIGKFDFQLFFPSKNQTSIVYELIGCLILLAA